MSVAMDKCTAMVRVRDACKDDIKANYKKKKKENTSLLYIDETKPRGHRFQAVSRQKLFQTYQF